VPDVNTRTRTHTSSCAAAIQSNESTFPGEHTVGTPSGGRPATAYGWCTSPPLPQPRQRAYAQGSSQLIIRPPRCTRTSCSDGGDSGGVRPWRGVHARVHAGGRERERGRVTGRAGHSPQPSRLCRHYITGGSTPAGLLLPTASQPKIQPTVQPTASQPTSHSAHSTAHSPQPQGQPTAQWA
jgi:hypothetical protein